MTRQAVSKHLAVLEDAGLVATVRRGREKREKLHYLNPVPIHEIYERWISRYEQGRLEARSPCWRPASRWPGADPGAGKRRPDQRPGAGR
jgi:hypothetical protein